MGTATGYKWSTVTSLGVYQVGEPIKEKKDASYYSEVREYGIMGFYYLNSSVPAPPYIPRSFGDTFYYYPASDPPPEYLPTIVRDDYPYSYAFTLPFANKVEWFEIENFSTAIFHPYKPTYMDLLNGYSLTDKIIPKNPVIIPVKTEAVTIAYYRVNRLEPIPKLSSIDWMEYKINVFKGISVSLPIVDCVLCTLYCDSDSIKDRLISLPTNVHEYDWIDLFSSQLDSLFSRWLSLWRTALAVPVDTSVIPGNAVDIEDIIIKETDRTLRTLGANNNHWNTRENSTVDLNVDENHPMFAINVSRTRAWHIKEQADRSYGGLTMDSPRLIEIHKALEAGKYSLNELSTKNPKEERVSTLAWHINRQSEILGIRVDAFGKIDHQKEKDRYLPATLNNPNLVKDAYAINCWGTKGLTFPNLPTTYTNNGKETQLWDVVHDFPQMAMALLRQLDVALSIQHGSEIRINGIDGKVQSYPNQLAVLLECLQRLEIVRYNSERTLTTALVTSNEVRGLYSGIGIPTTQMFMQLKDGKKGSFQLPYFTHQKNKPSIAQTLSTVLINQAVVNGVLMPKKTPEKAKLMNPFNVFKEGK